MGLLDRLFGKKRPPTAATTTDQARSQQLAGRATGQTTDEQAATRGRMEAEMDAQRQRRAGTPAPESAPAPEMPPCPHTALTPRWDSVADMGNADTITAYECQGCGQSFTAAEGRALLASEAERIRRELGTVANHQS